MAKEQFIDHKFNAQSRDMLNHLNGIIEEYRQQGYVMTLRQLYYQMIRRDLFPESWIDAEKGTKNNIKNYKKFGDLVSNARLAGLVDWARIEDRNRELVVNSHWSSPANIIRAAAQSFRIDRWQGQASYVEVMVEKDALSGILSQVCSEWDVGLTANKGYSSSSAMYEMAKRLWRKPDDCDIHIIYLGDHDPSGIDMTRDIRERLSLFTRESITFEVHRLALNIEQVQQWSMPENPAKDTDSRYEAYRQEFGDASWELDAVEPADLNDLVREQIHELIDWDTWNEVEEREEKWRKELNAFADNYKSAE